jgi:hypothetical protein
MFNRINNKSVPILLNSFLIRIIKNLNVNNPQVPESINKNGGSIEDVHADITTFLS